MKLGLVSTFRCLQTNSARLTRAGRVGLWTPFLPGSRGPASHTRRSVTFTNRFNVGVRTEGFTPDKIGTTINFNHSPVPTSYPPR